MNGKRVLVELTALQNGPKLKQTAFRRVRNMSAVVQQYADACCRIWC